MDILFWIVVGIIAGALAKYVVPGEGPSGIIGDLVVGVVGAFIGGFVARSLDVVYYGFVGTTVIAFLGAVILLFILRAIATRRTLV